MSVMRLFTEPNFPCAKTLEPSNAMWENYVLELLHHIKIQFVVFDVAHGQ